MRLEACGSQLVVWKCLVCVMLGVLGCSETKPDQDVPHTQPIVPARDPVEIPDWLRSPRHRATAGHLNQFAFELFSRLNHPDHDTALSPTSLNTTLAMLSVGARGASRSDLERTLHLEAGDAERYAKQLSTLAYVLSRQGLSVWTANTLFVDRTFTIRPEFLKDMDEHYGAGPIAVDFHHFPEHATNEINSWAKQHTLDHIDPLFGSPLPKNTELVLANATYLKAKWATPFDPKLTKTGPFLARGSDSKLVPYMHLTEELRAVVKEDLTLLELPYAGETLVMDIILPKSPSGLAALETSLTHERLEQLLRGLNTYEVSVALPRFKIERETVSLTDVLIKLGLSGLFNSRTADFSGIAGKRGDLVVADVVQRTFIHVNEEGTEAAAASAVVIVAESAGPTPLTIEARHPFMFVIRDLASGVIWFMGHVVDPVSI